MKIYLNRDWDFTEDYHNFNNTIKVDIPHSVKETSFNYFDEHEYQMISGYKKEIFVPDEWKNKIV